MTTPKPFEGRCERCKQPRPVFQRKPDHNCVEALGRVDLVEAARLIEEIEDQGDRWCIRRIEGLKPILLCVRCHDTDAAEEATHVKEHQL